MTNTAEMKRIAKFALFGAVGFGIGGLIGEALVGVAGSSSILGLPIMGAIGGATLGLALRRKVATLALVGAIGVLAGVLAGFFIGEELGGEGSSLAGFLLLTVMGMTVGAALGLALRNRREIIGLALAGALGFGIGGMILYATHLDRWLEFVLMGIIGGAFLGATLGFLEKGESANQSTPSPATP